MEKAKLQFSLRPATANDHNFLIDLRIKTMKPFFENTFGWNDNDEREKAIDNLNCSKIAMCENIRIGVIKVINKSEELHLHQLQFLPQYQKNGIGAELIRQTIKHSENLNKPITLFVVQNTPAKRLYEKYGFIVTTKYEHHCEMCRHPECH